MTAVMMVLMVEMMLMMIPMMRGVMAMTMAAIPPLLPLREGDSPVVFSLPELFFSLSGFRLVEAVEKLFVDAPDGFRSKGSSTPNGSWRGATGARGRSHPRPGVGPRQEAAPTPWSSTPCPLSAP